MSNAYVKAQQLKSDTLFIGDSIGRQIFPPNKDERYITTHGGILSAGNYLLVDANIKNNNNPQYKDVRLISTSCLLGFGPVIT